MPKAMSVLEKAQCLKSEAQRLDLGRAGAQEAQRVQARVQTLRGAIGKLSELARTARFLHERTEVNVDLSSLGHGYKELSKHAGGSIPSNKAFFHAERRITATSTALATELNSVWRQWAETQLIALEVSRITMLNRGQQVQANAAVKALRAASIAPPTIPQVAEFMNRYELLAEELRQAPDASPELLELLEKLDGRVVVALADVTDAQIAMLRAHAMDRHIELRRKPS